ncbi:MAG: uncharacterized protein QOD99_2120 [Chthoniobacter sp.]|nr:uncharacterized protein [Chthoniobacter sp.]
MKKADRMEAFVQALGTAADPALDPCYLGFFKCFNEQRYYEAHDVLEHLWLKGRDENYAFFKGLIQVAGAFVHLQKQALRPTHPKDGPRLRPASRLFLIARTNLDPYRPQHLRCDVTALCRLCEENAAQIEANNFQVNPWKSAHPPILQLL